MTPAWITFDRRVTPDHLGLIPSFLDNEDPDDAQTQLDKNYLGGFRPFEGFTVAPDYSELRYPSDPPFKVLAACRLREETVILYEYAWVLVRKIDGSHVIARMD